MAPLISPDTAAARARAAIGYAGLEHSDVSARTGLSISLIRRIVAKKDPRDGGIERLWAIADACGVPRSFMEHGWNGVARPEPVSDDEVRQLRARVEKLEAQGQAERLQRLAAEVEELRRSVEGRSGTEGPP